MRYDIHSPAKKIDCHILLPSGKTATKVLLGDKEIAFNKNKVFESNYVDFTIENATKTEKIGIIF